MNWSHAFEVVSHALSVISSAKETPLALIPYVGTIASAAGAINAGLKAGIKVAPYVEAIKETFAHGLPTEEKRSALDARIAELREIIHAALPPKEDGEPE